MERTKRIAVAEIAQENDSFTPLTAGLTDFESKASNEKKNPDQPAAQPNMNLACRHPDIVAKDPFYAAHEAAHGVTIDDKAWTVHEVNLDKRQTHADTAEFWKVARETNWKNPAQRGTGCGPSYQPAAGRLVADPGPSHL